MSSKRAAFRNKLKMSGGLSDYAPFNRFKGVGDRDASSVSSRFVIKVDDHTSEADFKLQSELMREELANDFEKSYEELNILGEGCASVVKKCMNKSTKEIRAVKIIRSDDDEYIEIAKKEFHLLRSLENDSVVKMYEMVHDEKKGQLYLVMEFVEGDTLEDYVGKF